MKWIGITGTWQLTGPEVESDVRHEVAKILKNGDGIVTGGALGVDFYATDEVIKSGLAKTNLKICLPVTLELYSKHYRNRAREGAITDGQAEELVKQLELARNSSYTCLIENLDNKEVNKETYYERNSKVAELSDELLAFQVNGSLGTQDTVNKARNEGKKAKVFSYDI